MKATIGSMVRDAREAKGMTRQQLAKKLDISPGYMGHIETDQPVRLSPRIIGGLKEILGRKLLSINSLVDKHNAKVRKHKASYKS